LRCASDSLEFAVVGAAGNRGDPSDAVDSEGGFTTSATKAPQTVAPRILVVDDDEDMRQLLAHLVGGDESVLLLEASAASEAKATLAREAVDVVITDLSMPGEDGLSLMQWSQDRGIAAHWIVLTGHGTLDKAVKALQLGAFDFISKPIKSPERLRSAVRNALAQRRLTKERDHLVGELHESNERLRDHVEQLTGACRLLRHQADMIRADLHRAAIIQRSLLPERAPELEDFHVHALYRPSENIGGDLYDVIRIDDRRIALLVADAAGHGLSAAMLAVHFRSQLQVIDPDTHVHHAPADVLAAVNRSLCDSLPVPGLFLTAVYCIIDTERREATVAAAGHPPLLWMRQGGDVERLPNTGPALGLDAEARYDELQIALDYGDTLLFYTDGLYDAVPGASEDLECVVSAVFEPGEVPGTRGAGDLARLADTLDERAQPLVDDVTVLMLGASPGLSMLDNGRLRASEAHAAVAGNVDEIQTLVGASGARMTFRIQGRGDWTQSAAFYVECAAAIEKRLDLVVDLSLCTQLDSTFLGTIHQLCSFADASDVAFRLQGVMPRVEDLFVELGMENVMEHIVSLLLPVPRDMQPVRPVDLDSSARARLLLRAHEGLASINEKNREEFAPLVMQLRKEVAELTRAAPASSGGSIER
jgi:FixJ family two-component response regulator/anti-anti-sigma regulatory factor